MGVEEITNLDLHDNIGWWNHAIYLSCIAFLTEHRGFIYITHLNYHLVKTNHCIKANKKG